MFAAAFDYHKASSVAEAIQLLGANEDSKLMAGGHSLIPLLKLRLARPSAVVDIGGISELKGISVDNGSVRIGALTTHWEIASSSQAADACSMLAEAAGGIGDTQVRNRGTIGGNVVHGDPASDWPAVLTALGATFTIQGPNGTRTASPGDFFIGPLTTAIAENEILTSVEVPRLAANQRAEYAKMAHPASGYAVVGAAVVLTMDDGDRCTAASVAVGGAVPVPTRATSVENALAGSTLSAESITAATNQVGNDLGEVIGDFYASAEYRKAMAAVEIRHAIFHATGLAHH